MNDKEVFTIFLKTDIFFKTDIFKMSEFYNLQFSEYYEFIFFVEYGEFVLSDPLSINPTNHDIHKIDDI